MQQKKYVLLLLLFASVFGLAQADSVSKYSNKIILPKNELDLDIEPLGIVLSYKRKISNLLYIGYGIGGGALFRLLTNFNEFAITSDFFRQKIFIDIEVTKRFHIYEACTYSYGKAFSDEASPYNVIGLETGFFYRVSNKFEIGFEPSVLVSLSEDKEVIFNVPLITLRVPLVK